MIAVVNRLRFRNMLDVLRSTDPASLNVGNDANAGMRKAIMNGIEHRSIRYMFEKYVSIACPKTVLTRSLISFYVTLYT
jgi:hypothetical protein